MKDYYALLSVAPDATSDDIKQAFRREIARYHPDKVHHLGQEFQLMAADRAAELTEAYRILMDPALRSSYDGERGHPRPAPAPAEHADEAPRREPVRHSPEPDTPPPFRDGPAKPQRPSAHGRDNFMRRAGVSRFREAIERSLDGVTSMPAKGFEASYLVKGKRSLFSKALPERILTAYVGSVTGAAITTLGQQALAARGQATVITVFALGDRIGAAAEIAGAVAALRRKAPADVTLVVVPVDVRDWTPMMPKDASANVRAVIAQLTANN